MSTDKRGLRVYAYRGGRRGAILFNWKRHTGLVCSEVNFGQIRMQYLWIHAGQAVVQKFLAALVPLAVEYLNSHLRTDVIFCG